MDPSTARKHSKLGIASFSLACLTGSCLFALFALAVILSRIRNPDHDAREVGHVLFLLCFFTLMAGNFLALALGIAGLAQSDTKRVFATLGAALAGLQLAASLLFILVVSTHH